MPLQDEALARRAAAGDSAAFAELYDRYARSAYNLCYRITGSRDDAADATQETFVAVLERLPRLDGRELNFGAYVMTAARNASYDALERRKRSTPTGEIPDAVADDPDVPERAALREAHQEQIRAANEGLPPRQREVLALRELQDLSYGEVAQIMGMNQNSVAQLISRARINLRDGLRQTALGSVASASPQCDRALPLLAARQDGVLEDPWLAKHLMGCGPCRVRLEAMEEAAVAYRQWLLLVPALWLRDDVAHAAERVSARPRPRGRSALAAVGATFALAFLIVEGAETPTRAYAPAEPTPSPEAVAVVRAAPAPKAVARRRAPKSRRRAKVVAVKPHVPAPVAPARHTPVEPTRVAAVPDEPIQPAREPAPRARPQRDPKPVPEPVVLADPPAVATPTPTPEEPPTPDEPPAPPCQSTSIAGCQPPSRPPTVTCTSCTLVAPPPKPPTRAPVLVAAPSRR
jgi:RNA polymerase sigma-70 factor (ECF subfamily)